MIRPEDLVDSSVHKKYDPIDIAYGQRGLIAVGHAVIRSGIEWT